MPVQIRQTGISETINLVAEKEKYDECAKKLLSYKAIIAWILKAFASEFSQFSVKYIMENCIEGEPEVSRKAVHQDQLDHHERMNGDDRIEGMNTESVSVKEQTVYFDIRFRAKVPGNEMIQVIINLEIQEDDTPGYPLVKRAFYYCARMISEQYGTIFKNEHYEKLCKVYSIWVCPNPAEKRKDGIFKYHTVENAVYGQPYEKHSNYDLMEVVIVNLGDADKKSDSEILDLLNTLFSPQLPPEQKKTKLEHDYKIAMTVEYEREVASMCNLSQGLIDRTTITYLMNIMETANVSVDEAMRLLKIEERKEKYRAAVASRLLDKEEA